MNQTVEHENEAVAGVVDEMNKNLSKKNLIKTFQLKSEKAFLFKNSTTRFKLSDFT